MGVIRIGICDDNKEIVDRVQNECKNFLNRNNEQYEIQLFYNGKDVLLYEDQLDIIILDVEIPDINGFKVAEGLRELMKKTLVIFLSNHEELIQEAFEVQAFRYIYKSNSQTKIIKALSDAMDNLANQKKGILIKVGNEMKKIFYKDIAYIQAQKDCTIIRFRSKEREAFLVKSLKWWEENLNEEFIRCHNSYIVNSSEISKLEKSCIILESGKSVPIATRKKTQVKNEYYQVLKKYFLKM